MTTFKRVARSEGRELAPEGWHRLRVRDAFETKASSGRDAVVFLIDFVDDPKRYRSIKHWVNLPAEGDSPWVAWAMGQDLRRFLELFGAPFCDEGFDEQQAIGCGATVYVGMRKYRAGGQWKRASSIPFPQPKRERLSFVSCGERLNVATRPGGERE